MTPPHRLSIVTVGLATGFFLEISFGICCLLGRVSTRFEMHEMWFMILPGVNSLGSSDIALGLAETVAYGWYFALVFVPIYNWVAARRGQ